jgi:hypothetical protein
MILMMLSRPFPDKNDKILFKGTPKGAKYESKIAKM